MQKKSMKVTIKAAYITAIALIVAAIITGIFSLKSTTNGQRTYIIQTIEGDDGVQIGKNLGELTIKKSKD